MNLKQLNTQISDIYADISIDGTVYEKHTVVFEILYNIYLLFRANKHDNKYEI